MRTLLFISMSLIAFQAHALNLGHYHQDGRKIISNVPSKCIKDGVLVCSADSIINNNEKVNIQNKDLGSIKTKINIKINARKPVSKPQTVMNENKPKLAKSNVKKTINAIPNKVITPIIAK